MAISAVPPASSLIDEQFIQISGPNGLTTGYQYDEQQKALYFKESQILFPSFHGATHIAEDPVPNATCDTPGLMSNDDKCKLDALLQTRLGVLGFQGAGFSDDGGWMAGDIILAAGTEFISLERIGNVIRFTVDSPIPLNCFTKDAPVLMADGTTRPIENISKGDLIVTHDRQIREVVKKFTNHYKGKVYSFKADNHRKYEFKTTHNHPLYIIKSNDINCIKDKSQKCRHNQWRCDDCEYQHEDRTKPQWVDAQDIEIGDFVVSVYGSDKTHNVQKLRIADWVSNIREENGEATLEYTNHSGNIQATTATKIGTEINLTPNMLWLFGVYLAEGHTRNKNIVIFSVGDHELLPNKLGSQIQIILEEELGLDNTVYSDAGTNGSQIYIYSSILARLFDGLFGRFASGKRIPRFLMELDLEQQKHILRGLFAGDAHRHKKQKRLVLELANKQLINQTASILQRLGHNPSTNGNNFRTTKAGVKCEEWTCTVQSSDAQWLDESMGFGDVVKTISRDIKTDEYISHRISGIEVEEFEGEVYNFEVEDKHTYVVGHMAVHNCSCEECQQIFFVQDETDIASIRPPSCGGKLPGINSYGEMKIYLFPESTIADPNSVATTLNNKGQHPSFIFKRYDDTIVPGAAEHEMVLKRDDINSLVTEIGWAMTPGATGVPEMVWFMGKDNDGNQVRFDLNPESEPGLLGTLLYKGNLITKKMGVIVDFTSTILSTNQYTIKTWDTDGNKAVGDAFTAKNVWQYSNPENPTSGTNPQTLILDASIDLLPIGTLVNLWAFKVGEVAGESILRYYFRQKPSLNPNHIWTWGGKTQFGDVAIAREEILPGVGSEDKDAAVQVSAIRTFERNLWGLTGYNDPLFSYDIASTAGTADADLTAQHRAVVDTTLPGLRVVADPSAIDNFSERPVYLWNRRNFCNTIVRADVGRPDSSDDFIPFDLLLRAQIDETENKYMRVIGTGNINGLEYVRICGVNFNDLPPFGSLRVLSPDVNHNKIFNYTRKFMFPSTISEGIEPAIEPACDSIILSGDSDVYPGDVNDIVELLHQEYNAPIIRVEFSYDQSTGLVEIQFKVGKLDMSLPYEEDIGDDADDFVRGLAPGYTVSAIYSQAGTFTGVGTQPTASPEGFVVYDGGTQVGGTQNEYWNRLEVMIRDDQIWIWWNQLLIPPSTTLSAALPTPVAINTPYYPIILNADEQYGKVGMRMWPGTKLRRMDLRTQVSIFSEFTYGGQLEIV